MKRVTFNPNGRLGKLVKKLEQLNKQKVEVGYFSEQPIHYTEDSYANIMKVNENGWTIMSLIGDSIRSDLRKSNGVLGKELKQLVHSASFSTKDLLDNLGNTYAHFSTYYFGNDQVLVVTSNPTPMVDTGELADNFAWRTSLTMSYKTVG